MNLTFPAYFLPLHNCAEHYLTFFPFAFFLWRLMSAGNVSF